MLSFIAGMYLLIRMMEVWVETQNMLGHEVVPRQDSNDWRPLENYNSFTTLAFTYFGENFH